VQINQTPIVNAVVNGTMVPGQKAAKTALWTFDPITVFRDAGTRPTQADTTGPKPHHRRNWQRQSRRT
jgi:hypothetical protein